MDRCWQRVVESLLSLSTSPRPCPVYRIRIPLDFLPSSSMIRTPVVYPVSEWLGFGSSLIYNAHIYMIKEREFAPS